MKDSDFEKLMYETGAKPFKKNDKKKKDRLLQKDDDSSKNGYISKDEFESALKKFDNNISFSDNSNEQVAKNYQEVTFLERSSVIRVDEIDREIDLHRLTKDQALKKIKWFLYETVQDQLNSILIVTGKGKHSKNGPILRVAIKQYLLSRGDIIERVEYAPKSLGGSGAFLVVLR